MCGIVLLHPEQVNQERMYPLLISEKKLQRFCNTKAFALITFSQLTLLIRKMLLYFAQGELHLIISVNIMAISYTF